MTTDTSTLDAASIAAALQRRNVPAARFTFDLRADCASTNSELLTLAEQGADSGTVVITERQRAGRGRRGRAWVAAPGDSLTFSLLWRFAPGTLPVALSLAVGVAIVRALRELGGEAADAPHTVPASNASGAGTQPLTNGAGATTLATGEGAPNLQLKWPNDVLLDGRKLAGVLIELVPGATHAAVIGIGLNRRLPAAMDPTLRAQSAAWPLATPAADLLAMLLVHLGRVCDAFAETGFGTLRNEWQALHAHQNRPVLISDDQAGSRAGLCRGVADDGALLLESAAGIERVLVGDVSLRAGS